MCALKNRALKKACAQNSVRSKKRALKKACAQKVCAQKVCAQKHALGKVCAQKCVRSLSLLLRRNALKNTCLQISFQSKCAVLKLSPCTSEITEDEKCKYCDKTLKSMGRPAIYYAHMQTKHLEHISHWIKCRACPKLYPTEAIRNDHERHVHRNLTEHLETKSPGPF